MASARATFSSSSMINTFLRVAESRWFEGFPEVTKSTAVVPSHLSRTSWTTPRSSSGSYGFRSKPEAPRSSAFLRSSGSLLAVARIMGVWESSGPAASEQHHGHIRRNETVDALSRQNANPAGHPDIHNDQIGAVMDGQLEAIDSVKGSQHLVTRVR